MFSAYSIQKNLEYHVKNKFNDAKNQHEKKQNDRARAYEKHSLAEKLHNHLSKISSVAPLDDLKLQIVKIKEIITDHYKPKVKEEENEKIKAEGKEDEKCILDAASIKVSGSLLFNFLKIANSLSPFHPDFLPLIQSIKELIHFFETQCCRENTHEPLDCNIMEMNYSVIWCASSMYGLINYLNNPIIEKNDWLEDYKIYEQRSLTIKEELKKEIPFWADYEKTLLSYQYLQEAEILFRSVDPSDKLKGARKLGLAEVEANKSVNLYLDSVADITTKGCGKHFDCAALYIYHELYKNYFEFNLHQRIRLSIDNFKKACEKGERDIQFLTKSLNEWNRRFANTQDGTRDRLRKKLWLKKETINNAANTPIKLLTWEMLLQQRIEDVEKAYISIQKDRFDEWDKKIKALEDAKLSKIKALEDAKLSNDLNLKYKELQAILQSIELPDGFIIDISINGSSTINLTVYKNCATNFLDSCFNKAQIGVKRQIKKNETSSVISFLDATNLDTNAFKEALVNYTTQIAEKQKMIFSTLQSKTSSEPATQPKQLSDSPATNTDAVTEQHPVNPLNEEAKKLNELAHKERKDKRNPLLYKNNMANAQLLFKNMQTKDQLKYDKNKSQVQTTLRTAEESEKARLEAAHLKNKVESNTIYDNTKLLNAFEIIADLKEINDDEHHIIFGCLLHVILELDYRLRHSQSHYNFDQTQKSELKEIARTIRHTFIHQCFDADSELLKKISQCILPLKVLFHKNYSELSKISFGKLKSHFTNLQSVIGTTAEKADDERIKSPASSDLGLLTIMQDLLKKLISYDDKDNDKQFFLCLGMIIKTQECTRFFSPSFSEIYGDKLDLFRHYRNQLAHREKTNVIINDMDSLYDNHDAIYNWDRLIEIKDTQAPILLTTVNELISTLQEQHVLINSHSPSYSNAESESEHAQKQGYRNY